MSQNKEQWTRMTTGELEGMLTQDLQTQVLSAEEILTISQTLLDRSPELGPGTSAQVSLERHRQERPKKYRRPFRRTLLIAAVLAGSMILSMLVGASGGRRLRQVVGAWDVYGFHFVLAQPVDVDTVVRLGEAVDPRWQQLKQTGHAPGLTPTWLPEEARFRKTSISKDELGPTLYHDTSYEYGGRTLWVTVQNFYNKGSGRTSVTGEPLEVYCDEDVIYYIFACNEHYVLTWFDGGFECRVMGLKTLGETRDVLRSVIDGKDGN